MFPQAISKTRATAPSTTNRAVRVLPSNAAISDSTRAESCLVLVLGYCFNKFAAIARKS